MSVESPYMHHSESSDWSTVLILERSEYGSHCLTAYSGRVVENLLLRRPLPRQRERERVHEGIETMDIEAEDAIPVAQAQETVANTAAPQKMDSSPQQVSADGLCDSQAVGGACRCRERGWHPHHTWSRHPRRRILRT